MMPRFAGRLLVSTALAMGWAGFAQAQEASAPIDGAARVAGVPVACAGVGESSRDNPRWEGYPVKLTFARKDGAFLGNEIVHVSDVRGQRLDVHCHAPMVLMGLPPGHYNATAEVPGGEARHISFTVPREGHRSIVLHYALEAPARPVSSAAYGGREVGTYGSGTYQNGQYYGGSGEGGQYQNSGYNQGNYPSAPGNYEDAPPPNAAPAPQGEQPYDQGAEQNSGYGNQGPQ
jgi:hypothetical protein